MKTEYFLPCYIKGSKSHTFSCRLDDQSREHLDKMAHFYQVKRTTLIKGLIRQEYNKFKNSQNKKKNIK